MRNATQEWRLPDIEKDTPRQWLAEILSGLKLDPSGFESGDLAVSTPVDGSCIGHARIDTRVTLEDKIARAQAAFRIWREVPAPRRGELVRLFGEELRHYKRQLAALVTLECGKIYQEGLGEVQEMIDICDFAVGLSRQLYGLTMPSERPQHRIAEFWHPMGVTGVITAFNFPAAVWAWNAALAIVCGDPVIWKPSEKTPLTAIATAQLFHRVARRFGAAPDGLVQTAIGGRECGQLLAGDARVPIISATGSTAMGRAVAPLVAGRFGRCILELGGNNAMIVTPSAALDLAVRAIVFAAAGTAGQRCTTLRRLIVHESIRTDLARRLEHAYRQIRVGNPFAAETLVGPLIDRQAWETMRDTTERLRAGGCTVTGGERTPVEGCPEGYYARPALVETRADNELLGRETFAPILYIVPYTDFDEALGIHNSVPQGLSSSIFTQDLREAEVFLSARGSDCGLANVNIGPSGAEIGGAFGGEKDTGGGRESGSDAWKSYMRRCTATINYSTDLPLAQGIEFKFESAGDA
jgi:aldehyde dehydrogenase (NAD+)